MLPIHFSEWIYNNAFLKHINSQFYITVLLYDMVTRVLVTTEEGFFREASERPRPKPSPRPRSRLCGDVQTRSPSGGGGAARAPQVMWVTVLSRLQSCPQRPRQVASQLLLARFLGHTFPAL